LSVWSPNREVLGEIVEKILSGHIALEKAHNWAD
jgi:hypothetical protein